MKKLVFSACALTLTCGTAVANNSDWDQLDNDVQALSLIHISEPTRPY